MEASGKVRGDLVRTFRQRARLTQPELAKRAGISERALRDIEQNKVGRPHPGSMERLAAALALSPDERAELFGQQTPEVSVGILGPLRISRLGVPLELSSRTHEMILGLLALEADRFVTLDEIGEVLWGETPPSGWRNRVHLHVNRLRQLVEPDRQPREKGEVLQSNGRGYRLTLPDDQLDAAKFRRLTAEAEAAEPAQAVRLWQQALGCWRGQVFAGDDGRLSGRPGAEALRRAKVTATLGLADAASKIRQTDQALLWLQTAAEEEPLHEGIHARLMLALSASGQQDRALGIYRELSQRLGEELGVDPTSETQGVYRQLIELNTLPSNDLSHLPRPAQLPAASPLFGGRDDEAARLISHLTGPARAGEIPAPRILVLHGMPGVGKSALALHLAHRIKHHFPDGQLFADLQGERLEPANPAHLLASFLRALGMPVAQIPESLTDRSAALRTSLAGKRVLLVLDDAPSATQLLPLLPSDSGNAALVTSRSPLTELPLTRHRVEPLTLDGSLSVLNQLLPDNEAVELSAAARLAALCAGLPLALNVAAGRVHAGTTLTQVAEVLSDERGRLSELHSGQLAVNSSLESAYGSLSPAGQKALRSLAHLPITDIPYWTADNASLAELVNAHLVNPRGSTARHDQHYAMHDLVRLFGLDKAEPGDADVALDLAVQYFWLAEQAVPRLLRRRLSTASLGIKHLSPPQLSQLQDDAHGWFAREWPNLLDVFRYAMRHRQTRLAVGVLNATLPYLIMQDLTSEYTECVEMALAIDDDPLALAYAHEAAARIHVHLARIDDGTFFTERGLELFRELGDRRGETQMLYHLQFYRRRVGRVDEAIAINEQLIEVCAEMGDTVIEAAARQSLGVIHRTYLDDFASARLHLERAFSLVSDDPASREYTQISSGLAFVYTKLGLSAEAERLLVQNLAATRAINYRVGVVTNLHRLADVWPPAQARAALDEALSLTSEFSQNEVTGHVHEAYYRHFMRVGEPENALTHARAALRIYRRINAIREIEQMNKVIAELATS